MIRKNFEYPVWKGWFSFPIHLSSTSQGESQKGEAKGRRELTQANWTIEAAKTDAA